MKQMGYLMVDHRASPGLPEDVARASGYDPKLAGEGKLFEADTMTCSHCKVSVIKNPLRTRDRGHCFSCNHYICDICAIAARQPDYVHTPFEKLIYDSLEERDLKQSRFAATIVPTQLILP